MLMDCRTRNKKLLKFKKTIGGRKIKTKKEIVKQKGKCR
jgi:hypothetical protein